MDEIVSDGHLAAYAAINQSTGVVRLHHPDGRASGEVRITVFESLQERFNGVTHEVKSELRARSFVVELIALVKRDSGKSGAGKEKWFRNHWTVPPALMASVHDAFGVDTEIFASPLNVHFGTKFYGSAFDRDRLFGSVGSAWSRGWVNPAGGSFEFNPEYESEDLKKAIKWAKTAAASTAAPVMAIGVYPEWNKSAFQPLFSDEDPLVHHLIQIPRRYFDFQTPDYWKGGESTYAHEHTNWDVSFFCIMNPAGADKYMGDADKRQAISEKLVEAFQKLVDSRGATLAVGSSEGHEYEVSDPDWTPLALNPYSLRADQYRDRYVRGFGIWQELRDNWESGETDGSEAEPTHKSLYEALYNDRVNHMRKPKAYPVAELTFPPGTAAPPGECTQTVRPECDGDHPVTREVSLKYPLEAGYRHVYTDGSGMTITNDETSEERFGAGMYDSYMPVDGGTAVEEDTSFVWHSGRQTVANGELFSIREALETKPRNGERFLRIFTDSLVTLYLLRKAKYSPWKLVGHENELTLRDMLDNIKNRVNDMGDPVIVSFHKVVSHTGVIGNERADLLAKNSCEEPDNARVIAGSSGTPKRAWVTYGGGAQVSGHHGVSDGTRKHMQKAMLDNEKISAWHTVSGGRKLDMPTTEKAVWGSHVPQGVRRAIHKARYGRLAVQQNLRWWFPDKHPSALCKLPGCHGQEETAAHMALKCTNPVMKGKSIARHDKVVAMFAKMLKRGKKGGLHITYDAGRKAREEQGRPTGSYTLDASLLDIDAAFAEDAAGLYHFVPKRKPGTMDDELLSMLAGDNLVGRMNPDIVMIERNTSGKKIRTKGTIHIIEVGYCWDPSWIAKQQEKEEAYAEVIDNLRESGWTVEFTVLPVGAMGMSVDFLNKEARHKLGITWKSYEAFRRTVAAHSVATFHDMWIFRCKTVAEIDKSHPPPPD